MNINDHYVMMIQVRRTVLMMMMMIQVHPTVLMMMKMKVLEEKVHDQTEVLNQIHVSI
jgi:hypothetical protein